MLQTAPLAVINHLLKDAQWARMRLAPFASRSFTLEVPPLIMHAAITDEGYLAPPTGEQSPNVAITVPFSALPAAARGMDALFRQARISGEADFAEAIGFVARNLKWDLEEDLSRLVGDIAAHRLTQTARAVFDWQKQSLINATENLAEYLTEETGVLLKPAPLKPFLDEVDDLRDAVARLEKRLEKLERPPTGRPGPR